MRVNEEKKNKIKKKKKKKKNNFIQITTEIVNPYFYILEISNFKFVGSFLCFFFFHFILSPLFTKETHQHTNALIYIYSLIIPIFKRD